MYAIVRTGGTQRKVAVGDVIEIDKVAGEPGACLALPAVLVVDGDKVTSDRAALADVSVTAEVVGATAGPKIRILKYKNKTGYRKRQGHRQHYTQVKVTDISGSSSGSGTKKSAGTKSTATKSAGTKSAGTKSGEG